MMEVVAMTGAIRRAKHNHQQINTQFFTGQMPFLSPNQQCQSTDFTQIWNVQKKRQDIVLVVVVVSAGESNLVLFI